MNMDCTTREIQARRIREITRTEAYYRGGKVKFEDVAKHVPGWDAHFIASQIAATGFAEWDDLQEEDRLRGDRE
jgi:hypothetical protein